MKPCEKQTLNRLKKRRAQAYGDIEKAQIEAEKLDEAIRNLEEVV